MQVVRTAALRGCEPRVRMVPGGPGGDKIILSLTTLEIAFPFHLFFKRFPRLPGMFIESPFRPPRDISRNPA